MMSIHPTQTHDFEELGRKAFSAARRSLHGRNEIDVCEDITQDVAVAILDAKEDEIRSPLGFAGALASHFATNHVRKTYSHKRFLERASIPNLINSKDDPSTQVSELEQRERLRSVLLDSDLADTIHLLAMSLGIPAHEIHLAFCKLRGMPLSLGTVYNRRNRAIERARQRLS